MKSEGVTAGTEVKGSGWARLLSFLLAVPLTLVLLIAPGFMVARGGQYSHGLLSLVMLGVSAGFVHAVGFRPQTVFWRMVFGPPLAWPLLVLGYGVLWRVQLGF